MGKEWDNLQSTAVKAVRRPNWEDGGGFAAPGIGKRDIEWPSFSATSKHGTANPTCAVCGGRLRGAKKCGCPKPHDHWKPIGKRKNPENEGLPDHPTSGGMTTHLNAMQEWHRAWLAECYRVLVPGGVLKAFSGTRTFHRLGGAMRDAGFIDVGLEAWAYGSGFPKSLNISKATDKIAGADAEVSAAVQAYLREFREAKGMSKHEVDVAVFGGTTRYGWVEGRGGARSNETYLPTPEEWEVLKGVLGLDDRFDAYIKDVIPSRKNRLRADGGKAIQVGTEKGDWGYQQNGDRWGGERTITAPATDAARTWDGWGTALKPSWEPVLVGRKPHAP